MKSLLSENMLRFGTKNLTATSKQELIVKSIMETIDQHGLRKTIYNRLVEQTDPNADGAAMKTKGVALKVVGMILKAFHNANPIGLGTDSQGIVKAINLIKNQDIYDAVLNLVKTHPSVTTKGRFNSICDWLSIEISAPRANSFHDMFTNDESIRYKIESVLAPFSSSGAEKLDLGPNI